LEGEVQLNTAQEEWKVLINDQAALIADPDARRDFLEEFVAGCAGAVDREEMVEMYELIDCGRWWAWETRAMLGMEDL
jgi:hypothetical protein